MIAAREGTVVISSALFAFLHHLAAFGLVAALAIELVLLRQPLTVQSVRALLRADMLYGIAAAVVLTVGALRVLFFEKGVQYYMHSVPFVVKVTLFAVVGVLSIRPTMTFLSWRGAVVQGQAPVVDEPKIKALRRLVHLELAAVAGILLCAALMARGLGSGLSLG